MTPQLPNLAVAFRTVALPEDGREALADALLAAFPEVQELSLKFFEGPGWVGAAELASGADSATLSRLTAWLRADPRVLPETVAEGRVPELDAEAVATLRALGAPGFDDRG
jgi:hypothetical protein